MQYQCSREFKLLRLPLLLLLLLCANTAPGQDPASSANSADPVERKYVLTGTVVNSVTGEPIPRALVQLYAGSNESMLTDFSGTFRFEGLQAGSVGVTTRKPGFFTPQELNDEPGPSNASPIRVQIGANMQPVTLQLVPQGSIVGRVINTEGEGVEDLGVRAFRHRTTDGRKEWRQRMSAATEEDGRFRIGNLYPGVYAVRTGTGLALGVATGKGGSTRELGYRPVFYPGTSELSSATFISVQAGQEAEADFTLRPEPLYHISGSVTGTEEMNGVFPELFDSSGEFRAFLRFDPSSNRFSADVVRGQYIIRAHGITGGRFATSDFPVDVQSDINGIQVPIGLTFAIPVRIRLESVRSTGAREGPHGGDNGAVPVSVRLLDTSTTIDPREFRSFPSRNTDMKDNPAQEIQEVERGKYQVEIIPLPHWYVQTASCGDIDLLRDALTITTGEAVPPIEIVLRDDPGRLTGIVQADQPNTQAAVLAVPENRSTSEIRLAFTRTTSEEFVFDSIPPGDYEIIALDHIAGLEYRNPEVLAAYLSRAVRVSVPRAGEAKANVQLIHRGVTQ